MGQSKLITRSIFIVEDEAIIRFNLVNFLEYAGYRVFEAKSADETTAVLDRDRSIRIVRPTYKCLDQWIV